jgi:hypothetical protein
MNAFLLNRELGVISNSEYRKAERERLLHAIQPANVYLQRQRNDENHSGNKDASLPHADGVNSIVIDRFEGK